MEPVPPPRLIGGDANTELASQRTAMAFDRTALGSDRTLMAVVRTALALIGFGFTIFQFFHKLSAQLPGISPEAPRRFGLALIVLGTILLTIGIYSHARERSVRRNRRQRLFDLGLIADLEGKTLNGSMTIAILLLGIGILALLRVAVRIGPF